MKLVLAAIILSLPFSAFAAQTFSGLVLSAKPEIARPGDRVLITATTVDRDAYALSYTWKVDGTVVADEVGRTSLSVTAPQAGDSTVISVEAWDGAHKYATEEFVIRPASLFLEWEAKSAMPPFYIGKPLVGPQGSIVVSAVPLFIRENGSRVSPQDVIFEWRIDGKLYDRPMLGKSSAEVALPFFNRPFVVRASASTRDGSLRADGETLIVPAQPDIVIYETSPLGGIIDQDAVGTEHTLKAEEVTLTAYPLYTTNTSNLQFAWRLNGQLVESDTESPRTVTFRKTGEGQGNYTVQTAFTNSTLFLERAARSFLLQF